MEENQKIEQLNIEAGTILSQIKTKNSEIDNILGQINAISESIKSETEQSRKKLDSKVSEAEQKINDLSVKEGSINTLVQQAQIKTSEIEVLNQKLLDLKTRIEDPSTGADAILVKINIDKEIAAEKASEAQVIVEAITKLGETSKAIEEQIKKNKEDIDGYKKEIEIMYGFINGSGLAHSFMERQDRLQGRVSFWLFLTLSSVLVLGLILYFLYSHPLENGVGSIEMFLYKVTYSAPGIFLLWFSALQYSRAQRLMESYAFKAATAKALENYTEVLERRFNNPEYKQSILEFVLASMKEIYEHPDKDDMSHEDKKIEQNAMVNFDSTLKNVGEKILDPINNFMSKIKGAKE